MQLFNINTGQYIQPTEYTFNAWKEGKRPFLILLKEDRDRKINEWEIAVIRAKDFRPDKVSYYEALVRDAKLGLLTPYHYSPYFTK